ncbi:MAG: NADPH-dependent F420 reductase, partial [Candidatus Methanofastidiosia archaeon]
MKKITIIGGTGDQGFGLALRFAQAGLPVVIGSRDKTKAKMAVAELKEKFPDIEAKGHENLKATEKGDIVIISVPYKFMVNTIKSIKSALKPGKIVVSLCVPLANAVGGKPTQIVQPWDGSAAEQIEKLVPEGVEVVGAFQNVCAARLA